MTGTASHAGLRDGPEVFTTSSQSEEALFLLYEDMEARPLINGSQNNRENIADYPEDTNRTMSLAMIWHLLCKLKNPLDRHTDPNKWIDYQPDVTNP